MKRLHATIVLLALASAAGRLQAQSPEVAKLLERVASQDIEVRYAARTEAAAAGAEAVAPLAAMIDETAQPAAGDDGARRFRREVALTAKAALTHLVHHAARPGADGERAAVAARLAEVLGGQPTPKAACEVLYLASCVAGEGEVPAVARHLESADRNVAETARIALERIPCAAATRALVAACAKAPDERKPDLLIAIGRKGDPEGVRALVEVARSTTGPVRAGALEGLAHAGSPDGIPAFEAALDSGDFPEKAQVFGALLRLADELAAADRRPQARPLYARALREAPLEHHRERALYQLSASADAADMLIAGLGDPGDRVRRLALERLGALGADALPRIRQAYDAATPAARPALLRVLAERDAAGSTPLVEEAARGSQAELKLTALDLQGKLDSPDMEPTYLQIAREGSSSARPVALRGYLLLADRAAAGGDAGRASGMYKTALEVASTDDQRVVALRGLVRAGDPASLDVVAGLTKSPTLAVEAARGVIALAPKLESKDRAEEHLLAIVTGEFPKDLRSQATDELRKLGRDPQAGVRRQGFVLDWWVLTPIDDPDGKGLQKKHFPEERIRLDQVEQEGGKRYRWQKLTEVSLDGRFNLLTSFRKSENVVTYAYTEVESGKEGDALFKMGSDDGIACWLNGERIHLNDVPRGLAVDADTVKARLASGKNRILLKIRNGTGDFGFAFRITDPDGKPMDLTSAK